MPRQSWSAGERRAAKERAQEWRNFRRDFLYNQQHLAAALGISKRSVAAVELAELIPTASTLRRFQELKRREEAKELAAAERTGELQAVRAAKVERYVYAAQGD